MQLRDLQMLACAAFADGARAPLARHIRSDVLSAEARIGIYRNNAREVFRKALAASYPTVQALVGDACFGTLAREYASTFASRSGNLIDFGAFFANLLTTRYGSGEFAYLPDVARLDWAMERALLAADAAVLDVRSLDGVPVHRHADLCFELHPSLTLIRSAYPVFSIWHMHQSSGAGAQVRLDAGGERVLVCRTNDTVMVRALDEFEYAFVDALQHGRTLAAATDSAGCDPTTTLLLLAELRQLVRFHLSPTQ